jgi:hypothetical protein
MRFLKPTRWKIVICVVYPVLLFILLWATKFVAIALLLLPALLLAPFLPYYKWYVIPEAWVPVPTLPSLVLIGVLSAFYWYLVSCLICEIVRLARR